MVHLLTHWQLRFIRARTKPLRWHLNPQLTSAMFTLAATALSSPPCQKTNEEKQANQTRKTYSEANTETDIGSTRWTIATPNIATDGSCVLQIQGNSSPTARCP